MPKIAVKKDFTMPGKPQFTAGDVFNVDENISKLAVNRGLAEVVKPKKETSKSSAKSEDKSKSKKSNKLKDE